jgi:hypothetical protein
VTFATTKQLIVMTLAWALVLCGVDYAKNPRPLAELLSPPRTSATAGGGKPIVTLFLNHLCCSGCLSDVAKALEPLSALKVRPPGVRSQEESDQSPSSGGSFANQIELEVSDLRFVDFMAIDRALRGAGFVADRMELRGPRHFRIEAVLEHFCCQACAVGVKEGLEITRGLKSQGYFKWLDSFDVVKEKKLVVAHARYDAVADVAELLTALNRTGLQPTSIYATADAESGR